MKKKNFTIEEKRQFERRYKSQSFKQPQVDVKYEWVDITFYMLRHKNFIKLSPYASKLYLYLREWAYNNEQWRKTGIFPYSQSMSYNLGIMSLSQSKRSLNELWENGFIDKRGFDYRRTQLWEFSNRWYVGGKQTQ